MVESSKRCAGAILSVEAAVGSLQPAGRRTLQDGTQLGQHYWQVPTYQKDENQEFATIVQKLENQMSRLNQQEVSLQTHTDKFISLKEGEIVPLRCHRKACISRCLADWRQRPPKEYKERNRIQALIDVCMTDVSK